MVGGIAVGVAVVAVVFGRVLPGTAAILAAAVGAVASGVVLWAGLRRDSRWWGVGVGAVLLTAVCAGATASPWAARQAEAGAAHAMLYAILAFWFGRSPLPGREAVVTGVARRLNGRFHAGMVPYTRAVTAAWGLFALGQLAASALLLAGRGWSTWTLLVDGGHAALAALLVLAEFAVRRWRFPGEHTGFWATVRGVRRGR